MVTSRDGVLSEDVKSVDVFKDEDGPEVEVVLSDVDLDFVFSEYLSLEDEVGSILYVGVSTKGTLTVATPLLLSVAKPVSFIALFFFFSTLASNFTSLIKRLEFERIRLGPISTPTLRSNMRNCLANIINIVCTSFKLTIFSCKGQ